MAKIQIFFAKLGKPAAVFGGVVADMSRIPSELAESMAGHVLLATRGPPTVTRQNVAAKFGSRSVATLGGSTGSGTAVWWRVEAAGG
jgi:hypothetical protein